MMTPFVLTCVVFLMRFSLCERSSGDGEITSTQLGEVSSNGGGLTSLGICELDDGSRLRGSTSCVLDNFSEHGDCLAHLVGEPLDMKGPRLVRNRIEKVSRGQLFFLNGTQLKSEYDHSMCLQSFCWFQAKPNFVYFEGFDQCNAYECCVGIAGANKMSLQFLCQFYEISLSVLCLQLPCQFYEQVHQTNITHNYYKDFNVLGSECGVDNDVSLQFPCQFYEQIHNYYKDFNGIRSEYDMSLQFPCQFYEQVPLNFISTYDYYKGFNNLGQHYFFDDMCVDNVVGGSRIHLQFLCWFQEKAHFVSSLTSTQCTALNTTAISLSNNRI